jgi:hypothetical protein
VPGGDLDDLQLQATVPAKKLRGRGQPGPQFLFPVTSRTGLFFVDQEFHRDHAGGELGVGLW